MRNNLKLSYLTAIFFFIMAVICANLAWGVNNDQKYLELRNQP